MNSTFAPGGQRESRNVDAHGKTNDSNRGVVRALHVACARKKSCSAVEPASGGAGIAGNYITGVSRRKKPGTHNDMPVQTILVAEDDAAIRDLVTHHLQREGFTVVGVADGQAALRRARGTADLVVLDVGLPGIDGFDVARTLRRERHTVPIVMLSARIDEVDRVVGFELGADDYVCKRSFSGPKKVLRVPAVVT